jgi:hypothetical protein
VGDGVDFQSVVVTGHGVGENDDAVDPVFDDLAALAVGTDVDYKQPTFPRYATLD